jgi:hypothetical protein
MGTSSSFDSQNDLELAPLDKIPTQQEPPCDPAPSLAEDDYDDDASDGDAGEQPLLHEGTQTRWEAKTPLTAVTFWKQTSGIVVEVSAFSHQCTFPNPRALDATNAPFHHDRQSVYGGTARQNIRVSLIHSFSPWCAHVKLRAALESDDQGQRINCDRPRHTQP